MQSKLSHYPYTRPQYEWNDIRLEETYGEYYRKYQTRKVSETGYYSLRKATDEEKQHCKGIVGATKPKYVNYSKVPEDNERVVLGKYKDFLENPDIEVKHPKKVYQYTLEGDFVREWDSITSCRKEYPSVL